MRFIVFALLFSLFACSPVLSLKPESIPGPDVQMSLKQVSEHVFYVQGATGIATDNEGFISNSAVILTDDGIVIFDALGTPALAEKLLYLIRQRSDLPIKRVYVSHYHADHIYGLQVFKSQGATVYAPAGAKNYLNSDGAEARLNERRKSLAPWVNESTKLIQPDVWVEDNQNFRLGNLSFEVQYFGAAHSHGDLSLRVVEDNTLLSGDLIFAGRIPFVGGNHIDQWIAKLKEIKNSQPNAIVPGHGEAIHDVQAGTALTYDYLVFLRDTMKSAVDELISFDEAYKQADWSAFASLPAFKRANRLNAYRIYLAMEAQALNE